MRRLSSILLLSLFAFTIFIPRVGIHPVYSEDSSTLYSHDEQSYIGERILFDESHCARGSDMWTPGNASVLSALLEEHGYTSSTNWEEELDSGILLDFDVLCIFFPQTPLTSGEITAIHDFVTAGGGLLLVGVGDSPDWKYTIEHLNPISEPYGIGFNVDSGLKRLLKSEGDLLEHPIFYDVESIHSNCDQLRGCTMWVTAPATSIATFMGAPGVAVCESGSGRVVAVSAPAPFIQYLHDNNWQVDDDDHFQFSLNVIDWLVGASQRKVSVPEKFYIRITNGPNLSPSEVEEYDVFSGVYHDHTTRSDGEDSPAVMVNRALETSLDFFAIADHSYDTESDNGIVGALEGREYQRTYGLDCQVFVAAELSSIPHTVGFPLTENIFTESISEAVSEIHAQDALAILAHPTIGYAYIDPWVNFDTYGYDAFEVDCRSYFHTMGESCYFRPFCGSNDGHAYRNLAMVQNVAFVKDPTGPNGAISEDDFKQAILDSRIVVIDLVNRVFIGKDVWVDRLIELWDEAEDAIEDCNTLLEGQDDVGYSQLYLASAENAMEWWNPSRALRMVMEANSSYALGLDIFAESAGLGVLEPNGPAPLNLTIVNRNEYAVEFNVTPFIAGSLTLERAPNVVEVPASSNVTIDLSSDATVFGYARVVLNIVTSNASGYHNPVTMTMGGMVRSIEVAPNDETVTIRLLRNREDYRYISTPTIHYDDGSGEVSTAMSNYGDSYGIELGPYSTNVSISFFITLTDSLGNNYSLSGGTYQFDPNAGRNGGSGSLTDLLLSAAIGGAAIAALVIVIYVSKRRKTP